MSEILTPEQVEDIRMRWESFRTDTDLDKSVKEIILSFVDSHELLRQRAEKAEASLERFKIGAELDIADRDNRLIKAEAEAVTARMCVGFFACCIKSGEPWTKTCDEYLEKSKLGSRFLARFKAMKEALTFISGQNLPGNWAVELARKTLQEGGEGMMIKLEKATPEIKEGTDVIVRRARAEKAEADAAAILDALQKLYDVVANETDMDACSDQLMDAMTNANEVLKAAAALREKK